jgi:methylmalonyl-CoA/ethylmalonyl-CoA epimerase
MSKERDLRILLDHVGLAVEDVDTIEPIFNLLGAKTLVDDELDFLGARWLYYEIGPESRVELLVPTEEGTFLTDFIEASGPGLHHVTFEVANIDDFTAHLEENGVDLIDRTHRPKYEEAFISPRDTGGILLQLIEYEEGYAEEYAADEVGATIFPQGERLSDR